jgi:hypothetical protein
MEMSCCPVRARRALVIGPKYVYSEVVVHCLPITQCAPVLEREPRFVPRVRRCDRAMLKWSVTWWRGAAFYHHRPVDRWVLAGGIERFPVVTSGHADSSGFVVRISSRVNPKDWVVIDGVPTGGRARPLIEFVIAGCLTAAWNVTAEFLRPR